jgi:hypothetical protein
VFLASALLLLMLLVGATAAEALTLSSGIGTLTCELHFFYTKRFLAQHQQDLHKTPHLQLLDAIRSCCDWIAPGVGRILGDVDEWNTVHYTQVVPLHPTGSSDMDISDSSGSDMDLDCGVCLRAGHGERHRNVSVRVIWCGSIPVETWGYVTKLHLT